MSERCEEADSKSQSLQSTVERLSDRLTKTSSDHLAQRNRVNTPFILSTSVVLYLRLFRIVTVFFVFVSFLFCLVFFGFCLIIISESLFEIKFESRIFYCCLDFCMN